jgi:hypothetical protein
MGRDLMGRDVIARMQRKGQVTWRSDASVHGLSDTVPCIAPPITFPNRLGMGRISVRLLSAVTKRTIYMLAASPCHTSQT